MSRDHFAQMYKNKSHRHDAPHDSIGFDEAIGAITGMLYSIFTLKAFFPKSPAPEMIDNPVKDAASGDLKHTELTVWE
jgi:hypothetical protein